MLCYYVLIYLYIPYLLNQDERTNLQTQDDTDIVNGEFRPLSYDYLPLKKYNPTKLYNYNSKEISVIEIKSAF